VTEEVWSWWRTGSVHRAPWPSAADLEQLGGGADARFYVDAQLANGEIRREKSLQGMKIKTPVKVTIAGDSETLNSLKMVEREIGSANTATIVFQQGDALQVTVLPSEEPGGSESHL
jgi:valyl-tRNA synthetase